MKSTRDRMRVQQASRTICSYPVYAVVHSTFVSERVSMACTGGGDLVLRVSARPRPSGARPACDYPERVALRVSSIPAPTTWSSLHHANCVETHAPPTTDNMQKQGGRARRPSRQGGRHGDVPGRYSGTCGTGTSGKNEHKPTGNKQQGDKQRRRGVEAGWLHLRPEHKFAAA